MNIAEKTFKGCNTPAQYYEALILADRFLVPAQMVELWEGSQPVLAGAPPEVYRFLSRTHRLLRMGGNDIRSYTRNALAENVTLFEAPSSVTATAMGRGRLLLICFAGNAGRLMLPTSVLLQQLPFEGVDVAMLSDPTGLGFLRGVPDYADDLHLCLQRLIAELSNTKYAGTYCLGSSGGGAASLYAGLLVGAKAALSIGGHHPTVARQREERAESLGITGMEFDALLEHHTHSATSKTRLGAMCGELNERDLRGAKALATRLQGCTLLKVKGRTEHGIMVYLCEKGNLPRILSQHLFGGFDD